MSQVEETEPVKIWIYKKMYFMYLPCENPVSFDVQTQETAWLLMFNQKNNDPPPTINTMQKNILNGSTRQNQVPLHREKKTQIWTEMKNNSAKKKTSRKAWLDTIGCMNTTGTQVCNKIL